MPLRAKEEFFGIYLFASNRKPTLVFCVTTYICMYKFMCTYMCTYIGSDWNIQDLAECTVKMHEFSTLLPNFLFGLNGKCLQEFSKLETLLLSSNCILFVELAYDWEIWASLRCVVQEWSCSLIRFRTLISKCLSLTERVECGRRQFTLQLYANFHQLMFIRTHLSCNSHLMQLKLLQIES